MEIVMRKATFLSVAGVIALGLAAPVIAQPSSGGSRQSAQANGAANAGDPNRVICARASLESGTRIARRVCRTAREWQQEEGGVPESR
jgi:hypothetical protein